MQMTCEAQATSFASAFSCFTISRIWLCVTRDEGCFTSFHIWKHSLVFLWDQRSEKNVCDFLHHHWGEKALLKFCLKLSHWLQWHWDQIFLARNKVSPCKSLHKIYLEPDELIIWMTFFIAIGNHFFASLNEEVIYAGKTRTHKSTTLLRVARDKFQFII